MKIKRETPDTITVNGQFVWATGPDNVSLADVPTGAHDAVMDFLQKEDTK